jgi:mono/diheme cytochrome c family protein
MVAPLLTGIVWVCAGGIRAHTTMAEAAQKWAEPTAGRGLYETACAACHASDGRGKPQSIVGFDTPIPDFTDCSFATPEPDADWLAVMHDGGPARAFDRRMPAFGGAVTDAQLQRILDYTRVFWLRVGYAEARSLDRPSFRRAQNNE